MSEYSQLPGKLDVRMVQGDTFHLGLTFYDANGVVLDLTGLTVSGRIHLSSTEDLEFSTSGTVLATGYVILSLTAAETADLTVGRRYKWEFGWINGSGEVFSVLGGYFTAYDDSYGLDSVTLQRYQVYVWNTQAVTVETSAVGSVLGSQPLTISYTDYQSASYVYFGGIRADGGWQVNRYDRVAFERSSAVESGNAGYTTLATAWAARASLTYTA